MQCSTTQHWVNWSAMSQTSKQIVVPGVAPLICTVTVPEVPSTIVWKIVSGVMVKLPVGKRRIRSASTPESFAMLKV